MKMKNKSDYRKRRHYRVRRKIRGTAERPRLAVFKSNKHLVAQVIDDVQGCTLFAVSTHTGDLKGKAATVETAAEMGKELAAVAKDKGIDTVVFDRGGFPYSGKIAAVAEAAREAGLTI